MNTPPEVMEHAVGIARLLADRARLDILRVLSDGPSNVSGLAEVLARPLPAVSQHLAKLRAGGLVTSTRDGVNVIYSLAGHHVEELVRHMLQQSEHLFYETPPHHR